MKITPVVQHLTKHLLSLTNQVSTEITSTTSSVAGNTLTLTFAQSHGLNTGDYVRITGAQSAIPVTSITRSGTLATVTTTLDHDLTKGYSQSVTISGADQTDYNKTVQPIDVLSATVFQYNVENAPATPATGTIAVQTEFRSYNGWYSVTKTNDKIITIDLGFTPYTSASASVTIRKDARISTIFTDAQFESFLARKLPYRFNEDKYTYILVRPGDINTSKNKDLIFDGVGFANQGQALRYITMEQLEIYILIGLNDQYITETTAYDLSQDLKDDIYKCLVGYRADTGFDENKAISAFVPVYARYLPDERFKNIFVYALGFEQRVDITNCDTYESLIETRAFRGFNVGILDNDPNIIAEGDLP